MVTQFAPRSNVSGDPCEGIRVYESGRPPMSSTLKSLNLVQFLILAILQAVVLIWLWVWRDKPRFRKVRPFALSGLIILGFYIYQAASLITYVAPTPCMLVVIFFTISLSWFGVVIVMRGLVLALEGNYARLARSETLIQDDRSSQAPSAAPTIGSTHLSVRSYLAHFRLLIEVLVGKIWVKDLDIHEIVAVKNSYITLSLILSLPAVLTCILMVALTPAYQSCMNCDIFLELPIGIASCIGFYLVFALLMGYQAYAAVGWDDKGVVSELLQLAGIMAPAALIVWILMIFDPSDLQYKNEFNWSFLFVLSAALWLHIGFFNQIRLQWQQERFHVTVQILPMDEVLTADPSLKEAFKDFAARHFTSELLNFIEDVKTFKELFFEKAENWRAAKFKGLVETYILDGSRMEINISHSMKQRIVHAYEQLANPGNKLGRDHLFTVFDDAAKEIEQMVHNGPWTAFLFGRARHRSVVPSSLPPA